MHDQLLLKLFYQPFIKKKYPRAVKLSSLFEHESTISEIQVKVCRLADTLTRVSLANYNGRREIT